VERVAGETVSLVKAGTRVEPGQEVRTGTDSEAVLDFADGTTLVLTDDTYVTLEAIGGGKQLRLKQGLLKAKVVAQPAGAPMVLRTDQAEVTVVGTEFSLSMWAGTSRLEVTDGTVRLTAAEGGASVEVRGGEYAETRGTPGDLVHRPLPRQHHALVGPLRKRPLDDSKVTYFVRPDGDDNNDGKTRTSPFATLQKAVDVVQPGETVLALRGVYKEGFWIHKEGRPDAWITLLAEPGAEIRGSDVRKDWVREPGQLPIYAIARPDLFPGSWQKPDTELRNRPEQVFVNGTLLRQVTDPSMLKPHDVFYVDDNAKKLFVCLAGGRDPNGEKTEVTMRTCAISVSAPPNMNWWAEPEKGEENRTAYVRIDGFRVRHIGNFFRHAAIEVRGLCHHITIENCDVQQVNYSGIGVNGLHRASKKTGKWFHHRPHHITVRNCISSRNGAQGVGGGHFDDCVFEYNLLDGNNYKDVPVSFEGGGMKLLHCNNAIMRGNVARGNSNHGLWFDYAGTGNVIENNLVVGSVGAGIVNDVTPKPLSTFPEGRTEPQYKPFTADEARASKQTGTLIRNNIVIATRKPGGAGVTVTNASDTRVENNIFAHNEGCGLHLGISSTRHGANGLFNNLARANICYGNVLHVTVARDKDDKSGRTFNNVVRDNLFIQAGSDPGFKIGDQSANIEAFNSFNKDAANIISDRAIFRDSSRWDFTLTDEALARRIGFDPGALRLDWSEFRNDAQGVMKAD
jgi:hypothetical protein